MVRCQHIRVIYWPILYVRYKELYLLDSKDKPELITVTYNLADHIFNTMIAYAKDFYPTMSKTHLKCVKDALLH